METEIVSSLLSASSKWKTFSVDTRRSVLEKATSSAKTNNAQSQTARKALAESTRAFKKCIKTTEAITTDDQKAQFQRLSASCKGIVKSYQEEIDKLTKRCKASDNLVLDLYKGIAEAPDPAPLLNNSVKHLESMTGQVSHLLKGMEEMQRELESKDKNYTESENNQNEELSQTQKLLKEALAQNQKLEKQLSNAKSVSSSTQNEVSYMSKEEKEELIELRREVAEYELEFKTLKNQDITIKKLNTKIEDLVADQEEVLQNELK
jgi:homeobox protein cut-like